MRHRLTHGRLIAAFTAISRARSLAMRASVGGIRAVSQTDVATSDPAGLLRRGDACRRRPRIGTSAGTIGALRIGAASCIWGVWGDSTLRRGWWQLAADRRLKSTFVILRQRPNIRKRLTSSPVRKAVASTMAASVFSQAMLIISGALSARILGPVDRGHFALLGLVPSILSIAGGLGMAPAITYFVARRPRTTRSVLSSVRRDLALQLAVLTVLHVIISVVWLLPRVSPSDRLAVYITLVGVPTAFALQYGQAVLQGHQRFGAFTAVFVVPQFLLAAGILALYVFAVGGLVPVMLVSTVAAVAGAVLALVLVRTTVRRVPPEDEPLQARTIRRFAFRSYFGQTAPIESFRLDQLVVGAALSPAVLGYYGAATAFTNLTRFLGTSIGFVLAPYIASLPKERQRRSLLRGLAFTIAVCSLATLALLPMTDFLVPLLFGDAFRPAIPLAQILLAAGFLLGVRRAILPGLRGIGLPSIGSYSELAALVVFAGLLPFALQSSTGMGVAVAFLVSAMVAMILLAALALVSIRRFCDGETEDATPAGASLDPPLPIG